MNIYPTLNIVFLASAPRVLLYIAKMVSELDEPQEMWIHSICSYMWVEYSTCVLNICFNRYSWCLLRYLIDFLEIILVVLRCLADIIDLLTLQPWEYLVRYITSDRQQQLDNFFGEKKINNYYWLKTRVIVR